MIAESDVPLGKLGIWSLEARFADPALAAEAAAEVEELGFGALWVPGGIGGDITGDMDRLLAATQRMALATGIINIWKHEPVEIADWWKGLPAASQSRLMLGVGISHGPIIGEAWVKPIEKTRSYVAELTELGVPAEHLCLAALGPRMVEMSGEITAGAHPYLITPEHTAQARAILGPDKLLAPEQGVILESDPAKAREMALRALTSYRTLPNYVNSWLRLGFTEADIAEGSDRLVDGLFAWGPIERIVERVHAHWQAGADHVCLQVITAEAMDLDSARVVWRELAAALL
jgi:probable F420-dependent oxidoreductase